MANDIIVIEYQAKVASLENSLSKIEQDLLRIEKESKDSMDALTKGSKKASAGVEDTDKKVVSLKDSLGNLVGKLPFAGMVQEVQGVSNAVEGVGQSAQGASKGFGVLRVAIMLALGPITLIIAGIIALIAFFKRTDEGATKLEGIMGAVGAVISDVAGFVAELGSAFFDAITSVDGFKEAMANLGQFLVDQVINRFTAMITLTDAVSLALKGKFKEAALKAADATIQLTLGIKDGTQKLIEYSEELAQAAKEAYDFAVAMDAISDAQRDLNVEIAANEVQIARLIKQSKNHSFTIEQRIGFLKEANRLEQEGLDKTLALEKQKLALIQQTNERELKNINRLKLAEIDAAKTQEEKIKLRKELLSINDDLAQEEAEQKIKISNLEKQSLQVIEKNNNSIVVLTEEGIQEQLKAIQRGAEEKENIQKQALLNNEITEEVFAQRSQQILLNSLNAQRALLIKKGKDTVEIDKAILDAQLKARQKVVKVAEEDQLKLLQLRFKQEENVRVAAYNEELKNLSTKYINGQLTRKQFEEQTAALTAKIQKDSINNQINELEKELKVEKITAEQKVDIEKKILDEKKKLNDIEVAEHIKKEEKKKAITKQVTDETINLAAQVLNGVAELNKNRVDQEIENERVANEQRTNDLIANLEKRKEAGLISEADFNAQKARIDAQAKQKESALKKKQFEADQKAAIAKIAIDTAVAVVKTLSSVPFPANLIAASFIAAQGALQVALVKAQPIPKFKDGEIMVQGPGTHTSDSIPAMISKDESIIKAKQSIKYAGVLHSINDDYFDSYINQNYIIPALKKEEQRKRRLAERQAGTAENLMRALELNGFGDFSHLERLTKSNKKVIVENLNGLPYEIGKEISRNLNINSYMK